MGLLARFLGFWNSPQKGSVATDSPEEVDEPKPLSGELKADFLEALSAQQSRSLFLLDWLSINPQPALQAEIPSDLKSQLLNPQYLDAAVPRLPAVLPKLMRALRDPEVATRDCVWLIKQDAALLAAVLHIANSSFYRPSGQTEQSIEQAVVSLGLDGLRQVVCAALLKPIAKRSQGDQDDKSAKAWQFSLRTALLAECLARRSQQDPFVAYLLGLCHGLAYITLHNEYLNYAPAKSKSQRYRALAGACLAFANELNSEIVSQWPLPKEVRQTLASFYEFEQQNNVSAGPADPLLLVLCQAVYANEVYSLHVGKAIADDLWPALCEQWSLGDQLLGQLAQCQGSMA